MSSSTYPPVHIDAVPSGLTGLYVPVHRRRHSPTSSMSSYSPSALSRASSPALSSCTSHRSQSPSFPSSSSHHCNIYTPEELISLSSSPFAKLSPEIRTELRSIAPDIVLTRKQRKSIDWNARKSKALP